MITGCHRDISVAGVWDGEEGLPRKGLGSHLIPVKSYSTSYAYKALS